ncbi:MAG TPA: penicillin-binding protein [Patescibacteria group bacterium]|nr:penicillin-binding protein [Patescibacteria group bacterium]
MPLSQLRVVRHGPPKYQNPRKSNKRNRKKKIKKWIKRLFVLGIAVFLIFVIYLIGAFAWYSRDLPNPNKILERNLAQSTKIYDRQAETMLYDVHGEQKRTLVKLENIPDIVQWATISAEDKHFYEHKGFNLAAMFKGVIIDPLTGKRARGGSTLTQQFVKNAILTNERKISRKIKEFILSYKIEQVFSKDEILQMYLNEIPYGSVAYGIQSASQTFLNKDVQDLTLGETAVLAALPKAPTYYSPYGSHTEELFNRQAYVLNQMVENGYITEEQAKQARAEEIEFAIKKDSIKAPHFVMYVKEFLSEKFGSELVENGGLKVITTLDMDKQEIAEQAVVKGVEDRGEQYDFHNASLVSLDPRTGQILAMVGSKDYFDLENDGNVNVSLSLRQPGSSMKPLVYLAAFKKGYTPNTVLYDVETTFKTETKDYEPKNYDLVEHGPVTMRKALQGSLNITAVKTLYLVGVQKVIDMLELFGYTSFEERSRFGLSLVLGGGEVKLLEHTAAFATLANEGVYHQPVAVLKVKDSKGNTLYEYKDRERRVIDSEQVNILNNVLSDDAARAYVFGQGSYLTVSGRQVAAKTGTTNDYRDACTMGYSPNLVAGVWVGNNDNSEMRRGAAGGVVAAPIWNAYMSEALKDMENKTFPAVQVEKTGKPILDGEIGEKKKLKIDKYSGKLATEYTPESAVEEKTFYDAHCILHYLYKDDPRGPIPEDPLATDPQYDSWESAVVEWLKESMEDSEEKISNLTPPTEFDDVHKPENKPNIFITNPEDLKIIDSANLTVQISTSAPRGVSKVEYYMGNRLIKTVSSSPYDLINYRIKTYFPPGNHELRAVAYDDVDNSAEAVQEVNFNLNMPQPNISWTSPKNGVLIGQEKFPVNISAVLNDLLAAYKVKFYQKHIDSGKIKMFATVILPKKANISAEWKNLQQAGKYELYAEIIDQNRSIYKTDSIFVTVE